MGEYNFEKDISIGEKGEMMLVNYYNEKYGINFIEKSSDDELSFWDLKFNRPDGSEFTTEVKTDIWVIPGRYYGKLWIPGKDSGNIFIESRCRNKNSGISITKAYLWVNIFYYLNEIWFIKVDDLKELINNNDFRLTENSGDVGSNTMGYLIPREEYKKHFIIKKI